MTSGTTTVIWLSSFAATAVASYNYVSTALTVIWLLQPERLYWYSGLRSCCELLWLLQEAFWSLYDILVQ
jgi:hypothetical protein